MKIDIPYDQSSVALSVEDSLATEILHPACAQKVNADEVILNAINNPIDAESFESFLNKGKILFILNDTARPTRTEVVLSALKTKLENKDLRFIIATGSHRKPTIEDLQTIFGLNYNLYKDMILTHNAKDVSQLTYLGDSPAGTPVKINRIALDVDGIVIINSVEPHYFAGYTGARKSILPGIAAHETITHNHTFALLPEAKTLALEGNPVHEDMMNSVSLLRTPTFVINVVQDCDNNIVGVTTGHLKKSFLEATKIANEVFCVSAEKKADIVVTVAKYPMDIDLYQSQKALENGKLALKDGGIIILVSKCREGIGNETFYTLLKASNTPDACLQTIRQGYVLGYHKTAKIAELAMMGTIYCVSELEENTVKDCFMTPFKTVEEAFAAALKEKGPDASVLFLMDGAVTVPLIKE